jgi:hypothetical protein
VDLYENVAQLLLGVKRVEENPKWQLMGPKNGDFSAEKAPFQRTVGHLVGDSVEMVEDHLLQVHLDLLHLSEDDAALPLNLLLPEGGVGEDVGEDLHRPLHVLSQALRVENRLLPAPYSEI